MWSFQFLACLNVSTSTYLSQGGYDAFASFSVVRKCDLWAHDEDDVIEKEPGFLSLKLNRWAIVHHAGQPYHPVSHSAHKACIVVKVPPCWQSTLILEVKKKKKIDILKKKRILKYYISRNNTQRKSHIWLLRIPFSREITNIIFRFTCVYLCWQMLSSYYQYLEDVFIMPFHFNPIQQRWQKVWSYKDTSFTWNAQLYTASKHIACACEGLLSQNRDLK